ncbi:MAG: YcxB family protein [Cytophagaceae bacterium]|jgi:hypothetical protein|nr:YcxB family protein [Cytophagaceae bacterium]
MIAKTKKYQLPKNTYVKLALINLIKKQWWYIAGPIAFACLAFIMSDYKWWFIITSLVVTLLYVGFWALQFFGVTQLPQNQIMFDKLSYEIDSRQMMVKLDAQRGSPIKWEMITEAQQNKDHFLLIINKAQMFYLPYKIFNSDHDIKLVETILKRKEYIK